MVSIILTLCMKLIGKYHALCRPYKYHTWARRPYEYHNMGQMASIGSISVQYLPCTISSWRLALINFCKLWKMVWAFNILQGKLALVQVVKRCVRNQGSLGCLYPTLVRIGWPMWYLSGLALPPQKSTFGVWFSKVLKYRYPVSKWNQWRLWSGVVEWSTVKVATGTSVFQGWVIVRNQGSLRCLCPTLVRMGRPMWYLSGLALPLQ